jgi:tetratricopeptide (TPR) repeat protein
MAMLAMRLSLLFAALSALSVSAKGAPHPQADPNTALKQAIQLTREHRYGEAESALKGVPPPTNPAQRIAYLRLKAAIASGLGHFAEAAEDMAAAAAGAPEDQDLRIAAGIARLQEQVESHTNPAQTLKRIRSESLPPDRAIDIRLRLAAILSGANLFKEAATDFLAASALAPERADLLYDLGLAHFRSGQLGPALESAERAKNVQDSASLESLIGDIQEKLGKPLEAVHSYQAAVTLEPSEERYRLALALELLRHQTFDAALVVLNQAAVQFPNSIRVKILLGLTYYFVDRSADAIHALLEAATLDPQDETAARYLGEITLQDAATPDPAATAHLCKFADEHPQNKTADAFCGGILLRLARDAGDDSRRDEVIRRLQHAALAGPKEPVVRCQLGKAFEWLEQWREARPEMEACVRLDPGSPDGHYQLSRIYRRLGLNTLADRQTNLQEAAARRQSEESVRRTESVTRFLVLLDH